MRSDDMNILIVDDDAAIVESICHLVNWKKLGIDVVRTASGAAQAKMLIREEPADIVVSDIEMPKESGLDLLRWFREQGCSGKFLLLTCHESFSYAREAIKLRAEEYLLKPFRVDMIEMVLQKMTASILEEREKNTGTGTGVQYVRRRTLGVLSDICSGRISADLQTLKKELPGDSPFLEPEKTYRIVMIKATNLEKDEETYGKNLILFTLENMMSELLTGAPENARVISDDYGKYMLFTILCDAETAPENLRQSCHVLLGKASGMFSLTLTCCISTETGLDGFCTCCGKCREILDKDVIHYGSAFFLDETLETADRSRRALDLKVMEEYLNQKNKKAFLDYIKKEMNTAVQLKTMDHEQMTGVISEIQQAVYAHLAARGILITLVLENEDAAAMSRKAEQSVIDLIRWVNYLLSRVFAYEEELQKSSGIIQEIDVYIQQHYRENIGRNEIGAAFYLVPEYVAKLYKKKTGIALKDAINEYRLGQAKALLLSTDRKVSDIAADVGFDNFSYFSTLFKKNLGMTPNEYRKQ